MNLLTYPQFRRAVRSSLANSRFGWAEVRDHFLLASYRSDMTPQTTAALFINLVELEE